MLHVLLVVNSYVTPRDPRRGEKFRLQLEEYRRYGIRAGLVAAFQRDYGLPDLLRARSLVLEEMSSGSAIIRDCRQAVGKRIPGWSIEQGIYFAERSVRRYIATHGRPDVIHAHGAEWSGAVAARASRRFGIPYVLTEHMSHFLVGSVDAARVERLRDIVSGASLRLPVSNALGRKLEEAFGEAYTPWIAIPNMVDESLFKVQAATAEDRPRFRFLTVGRLAKIKALDVLLRAFADVFRAAPVELRIAGEGRERASLETLTAELGLEEQVTFLGKISRNRVADELAAADAYVLASHHETFGIPVLEALAAGKPVVTTRCGGPDEVVDASNGLLVPVGDQAALGEAMLDVVARIDHFDARAISDSCRAKFAPGAVMRALESVYLAVASNPLQTAHLSPSIEPGSIAS